MPSTDLIKAAKVFYNTMPLHDAGGKPISWQKLTQEERLLVQAKTAFFLRYIFTRPCTGAMEVTGVDTYEHFLYERRLRHKPRKHSVRHIWQNMAAQRFAEYLQGVDK